MRVFTLKLFILFSLFFSTSAFGVNETQIKAIFLEKFTHLVQWPQGNEEVFTICIIDDNKFAKALKAIYKNQTFNDKPVKIITLKAKQKVPTCQLLYIGEETHHTKKVLQNIENEPVLTVSDNNDLIDDNVMITIFLKQKKFKYIINNAAAAKANVKISYLLLQSAQRVIK